MDNSVNLLENLVYLEWSSDQLYNDNANQLLPT